MLSNGANHFGAETKSSLFHHSRRASVPLFQLNTRTFSAVQQPSQVKDSKCIAGMRPDQRCKGRHGRAVSGFELGERLTILRRRRSVESRLRQRFVSPQRLAAPAQHQITDRPATKLLCAVSDRGSDANMCPKKLVGSLQPRRRVDGVAISGVVEETAAAEVAH